MRKYLKYAISILLALLIIFSQRSDLVVNKMSQSCYYSEKINIISDVNSYNPYRRSGIGIGLTANANDLTDSNNYKAKWSTNYGQFVKYGKNLTTIPLGKQTEEMLDDKVYWIPNHNNQNAQKNIYFEIYATLIDKTTGNILGKNKIKLIQYSNGNVYVQ